MKYLIEHMEGEPGNPLSQWCKLEYAHMMEHVEPERIIFTNIEKTIEVEKVLGGCDIREQPLEQLKDEFDWKEQSVCLLDMDAAEELTPADAQNLDIIVLGGILGNVFEKDDGTYGSDDRTAEVRKMGFVTRRHLGALQMTTDTALITAKRVLEDGQFLAEIPFINEPEITLGKWDGEDAMMECPENAGCPEEIVEMTGFRYLSVRNQDGEWEPLLPKGMKEHLAEQADGDLLEDLMDDMDEDAVGEMFI